MLDRLPEQSRHARPRWQRAEVILCPHHTGDRREAALPCLSEWLSLAASEPAILVQIEKGIDRKYLGHALRCFVQARNLCPVLARAQLRLVALAARLDQGDKPVQLSERATNSWQASDPEFWFIGARLHWLEHESDPRSAGRSGTVPLLSISKTDTFRSKFSVRASSKSHPEGNPRQIAADNPELIVNIGNGASTRSERSAASRTGAG